MNKAEIRPPSNLEKGILDKLLSAEFPGASELRQQMREIKVQTSDLEGSVKLFITNKIYAEVLDSVPVEASYADSGEQHSPEIKVHILLHVYNGLMHELEFYKDDSSAIMRTPELDELLIETNGTPWT